MFVFIRCAHTKLFDCKEMFANWTDQCFVSWRQQKLFCYCRMIDERSSHQICLIKELAELQELQWVGSWADQSINLWVIQEIKLKPGWQIKLWVGHRRTYFIAMIMIDMHSCVWHVFIALYPWDCVYRLHSLHFVNGIYLWRCHGLILCMQ